MWVSVYVHMCACVYVCYSCNAHTCTHSHMHTYMHAHTHYSQVLGTPSALLQLSSLDHRTYIACLTAADGTTGEVGYMSGEYVCGYVIK